MTRYAMRVSERKLSDQDACEILEEGEFCVVSTVDEDGTPYGVPLSYVMVDGRLCIHTTNRSGHKLDDFARDGRVCVTVANEVQPCFEDGFFTTRYASVVARGRIVRVEDGVLVRKVLVALCMKYLPQFKHEIGGGIERELADTAVWAVDFDEMSAKGARRLPR